MQIQRSLMLRSCREANVISIVGVVIAAVFVSNETMC